MHCRHFADVIVAEDPDVIALQEVRIDAGFTAPTAHIEQYPAPAFEAQRLDDDSLQHPRRLDMGAQVDYLLLQLSLARKRASARSGAGHAALTAPLSPGSHFLRSRYYHVAYHPAMSFYNKYAYQR